MLRIMNLALVIVVTGCTQIGTLVEKYNGKETASKRRMTSASPETVSDAAILSDENGVVTAVIGSGAAAQKISGSAGSDISGSHVIFPPGALAVGSEVTFEAAADIATRTTANELQLDQSVEIHPAHAAVAVQSSDVAESMAPFTMNIPISGQSGLLLMDDYENLNIIYKVRSREGGFNSGVIPRQNFKVGGGLATFQETRFGVYQAAFTSVVVTAVAEVVSTTPILTKVEEQKLPAIEWNVDIVVDNDKRKTKITFSLGNEITIDHCLVVGDLNQKTPWDLSQNVEQSTAEFSALNQESHTLYVQIQCRTMDGRDSVSSWEKAEFDDATPVVTNDPVSPAPDAIPPTDVGLTIAGGVEYVNSLSVALALVATGATEMYVTNTMGCGSGGAWEPYGNRSWLLPVANGLNAVFVKFRDAAANESACVSDSVTHDGDAPVANSFAINGGDSHTNNVAVTLALNASGASEMYVTESADCSGGGVWEAYNTAKNFNLSQLNTMANLYAKFRDQAGNESSCLTASINHDNVAPTGASIQIAGGAASTNSTNVMISFTATEASMMYVTNASDCAAGGVWEPVTASRSWILTQTNSIVTVYVKFKDDAGNFSNCVSDTIVHDDQPPTNETIVIANYSAYTNVDVVFLSLSTLGATEMYVTNDAGCASGGSWEVYANEKSWALGQTNAMATVYAKFRDPAGNETSCVSDDIAHDNTPPGAFTINNPGSATILTPTWNWSSASGSDYYMLMVDNEPNCPSPLHTFSNITGVSYTQGVALVADKYYVCMKAYDSAGNYIQASNSGTYNFRFFNDSWGTALTTSPAGRTDFSLVYVDGKTIVFGGTNGGGAVSGGSVWNGASWTTLPVANQPTARRGHTAVVADGKMIIWGGYGSSAAENTGGIFNTTTNTWTATAVNADTPFARRDHVAVWTGSRMLIWGGADGVTYYTGGRLYDPTTDTWTYMAEGGYEPAGRKGATAVWTGTEMIVWGGFDGSTYYNDGARYNPTTDSWYDLTATNAPVARWYHTAVWTGTRMIVFGGCACNNTTGGFNTGGIYDPATNTWETLPATGAPSARKWHTAVWTGSDMIIWGGHSSGHTNTGALYNPGQNAWVLATSTTNAASSRMKHGAVWTGTQMVIWGGDSGSIGMPTYINTGTPYSP